MNYSVSVIVPVYNCERYLERAIESVIKQKKFNECELILIDDGSTDNSPVICDSYSSEYDNIISIHQPNTGVSVARNKGIEVSSGEWICFLDSDDYLLPDALDFIDVYSDTDIICCRHQSNQTIDSDYFDYLDFGTYEFKNIKTQLIKSMLNRKYFYTCWSKFFRRNIIVNNNITFPAGVKIAEDMVFVLTYLTFCNSLSFSEKPSYFYFVNEGNTTNVVAKSFDILKFIFNWKTDFFKNNNWYTESVEISLTEVFVWESYLASKSVASHFGLVESVVYLNKVFNDNQFYKLYIKCDYTSFKTNLDKVLDWSIRNRKPVPFCLFAKLTVLKSQIFKMFLR